MISPLADQAAVVLEVAPLQLERLPRLPDLRLDRGDLLLHAFALGAHQRGAAVQRLALGLEQRALLGQGLLDPRVLAGRLQQVVGKAQLRGQPLLGLQPDQRDALDLHPVVEPVAVGLHPHVAQDQHRVAGLDVLAVAHQDLAHRAAFEVLHRPPVEVDLHHGRRHHRHGQRREAHPQGDGQQGPSHDPASCAHEAAGLALGLARRGCASRRGDCEVHVGLLLRAALRRPCVRRSPGSGAAFPSSPRRPARTAGCVPRPRP
jgi:hypothetical protein